MSRSASCVISSRHRVRDLATIATYYITNIGKNGLPINRCALVRMAIEDYAATLVANGHRPIQEDEEAISMLTNLGLLDLEREVKTLRRQMAQGLEIIGATPERLNT